MLFYYLFRSRANRWMLQQAARSSWRRMVWIAPLLVSVAVAVTFGKLAMVHRERRQKHGR